MTRICDTGSGQFISMSLTSAFNCSEEGTEFDHTKELILPRPQGLTNITNQIRVRTFGEWTVTQEVFDAPRADDPCGVFRRKRYGCDRDHDAWEAEFEYPKAVKPAGGEHASRYDLSLLVGAEGIFRRTQSDGSYWEGLGRITMCTVMPSGGPTDEQMGTLAIQWRGGRRDGQFDPFYVEPVDPS